MTNPDVTPRYDPLVHARSRLGVAHARHWLALKRANNKEGVARTVAFAEVHDLVGRVGVLHRRVQALEDPTGP
jgi:hypothetical protein